MKKIIMTLISVMTISSFASAATPSLLTVKGYLIEVKNVQRECGGSIYGFYIDGVISSTNGKDQPISACLNSIAMPLSGMADAGASTDLIGDSAAYLATMAGKSATMTFYTSDISNIMDSELTLLAIDLDQKEK